MKTNTLTLFIFLLSCSKFCSTLFGQTNEENFEYAFENIEPGIYASEVKSILGQPMEVQYNENSFAYQYCLNLEGDNKYFVVSFNNYAVSNTYTYFIDTYEYNECTRCINCFDEIELIALSGIEKGLNNRIKKNYQASRSDVIGQLDSLGAIVLANRLGGMKFPFFMYDLFTLQTIVDMINSQPDSTFILVGHTSSQGSKKANLSLSKKRAETLKSLLIQDFRLNPDKISTDGEGEINPIAPNKSYFGRSLNSRVELRLNNGEF